MLLILIIIQLIIIQISYGELICINKKIEPTVEHVFNKLLGNLTIISQTINNYNPKQLLKREDEQTLPYRIIDIIEGYVNSFISHFLYIELPFQKILSDSYIVIDMNVINFNNILLYQQHYYSIHLLHNIINYYNITILQNVISSTTIGLSNSNSYLDNIYYRSRPCSDISYSKGSCVIPVDPFRQSCLLIDNYNPLSNQSIKYYQTIPTMKDCGNLLHHMTVSIEANIKNADINYDIIDYTIKTLHFINTAIDKILNKTPYYVFNLLIGLYIYIHSDSLATSMIFQNLLIGTFGLLLAVAWIVLAIYKVSNSTFQQTIPFGSAIANTMMISSSFMLTNTTIRNTLLNLLWNFWDNGSPFGIWYLGKLYCVLSILFNIFLAHFFGIFTKNSISLETLRYSLKLIGFYLLSNSSSNKELAVIVTVFIVLQEDIRYWIWSTYLITNNLTYTPTYTYTGKKLTIDEYNDESKHYTERELNKLKSYLQDNPQESSKYIDLLRTSNKNFESSLLFRFIHHGYLGIPYNAPNDENDDDNKSISYIRIFGLFSLALCIAVLGISIYSGSNVITKLFSFIN